jgi:nicotinate dehydrogenase subunit B
MSHPTGRATIRRWIRVNDPFGTIYGSNITPDPKTGVGVWSFAAFTRAMHEGVSRDGSHLFAAFPYTAYTELSDDDVKALGDESQQPTWPHSRQRRR